MISFSIPVRSGRSNDFFDFTVDSHSVLFAGSRFLSVEDQTAKDLVNIFGSIGFSFLTGCASGVDDSFRLALSRSDYKDRAVIGLAFPDRIDRCYGLSSLVVSKGFPPKVALARRTIWMCSTCSLLVLFPESRHGETGITWGRGSTLAFNTAVKKDKPVFVVTDKRPTDSDLYSAYPSSLFGVVKGYWCIPEALKNTGLSNEMRYKSTAIA